MHPDAIIAIAAAKNRKELTQKIFGDEIGWLPWKRPGFELGLWLEKFCRENPQRQGRRAGRPRAVHLGRHARRPATRRRIGMINQRHRMVRERDRGQAGLRRRGGKPLPADERRAIAAG